MEDSIKLSQINNRKIVIEIRYEPNPSVIDNRGALVQKLADAKMISNVQWELGVGEIRLADSLNPNESKQIIYADMHRFSVISSKNETNNSFLHFYEKAYKIFKEIIPTISITRIGCRVQGTYKSTSEDFNQIVNKFTKLFPSQFLLEEFNVKDLKFQVIYQNGQYHIGPIDKDDVFINTQFPFEDVNRGVGFAIDTDNYIIRGKEKENINDSSIKDVYMASLSVEKSLFEKLNSI